MGIINNLVVSSIDLYILYMHSESLFARFCFIQRYQMYVTAQVVVEYAHESHFYKKVVLSIHLPVHYNRALPKLLKHRNLAILF